MLRPRPRQPQRLVPKQRIRDAVPGRSKRHGQHNAQGDQLRWDALEISEALGDRVGWQPC